MPLQSPIQAAQEAAALLLEREAALQSIEGYWRYMHKHTDLVDFKFLPAAHHIWLVENFQKTMTTGGRMSANLCPGAGKSVSLSIIGVTWLLINDPTAKILCATNSDALGSDFNNRRKAILMHPAWQTLSGTKLHKDRRSAARLETELGGQVRSFSVGATITGFRGTHGVLDDPVPSLEFAMSPTALEKQLGWWTSEFLSRMVPTAAVTVCMTKWSVNDISSRVERLNEKGEEDWTILKLPLFAKENDPMGRKEGELLWPEWLGKGNYVDTAKRDPMYRSLYLQENIDEAGIYFPFDSLRTCDKGMVPRKLSYVIGCDLAYSVQRGDYTVFAVVGVDERKHMFCVDVFRKQCSSDVSANALLNLCEIYQPKTVFLETDPGTKQWAQFLAERARNTSGGMPPIKFMKIKARDKEQRASSLRGYVLQERITFVDAPWTAAMLDELGNFPGGAFDDQVDALAMPAREFLRVGAPLSDSPRQQQQPEIPSALKRVDGRLVVNSCLNDMFKQREQTSPLSHITGRRL